MSLDVNKELSDLIKEIDKTPTVKINVALVKDNMCVRNLSYKHQELNLTSEVNVINNELYNKWKVLFEQFDEFREKSNSEFVNNFFNYTRNNMKLIFGEPCIKDRQDDYLQFATTKALYELRAVGYFKPINYPD